jgi:hypothetical protein
MLKKKVLSNKNIFLLILGLISIISFLIKRYYGPHGYIYDIGQMFSIIYIISALSIIFFGFLIKDKYKSIVIFLASIIVLYQILHAYFALI